MPSSLPIRAGMSGLLQKQMQKMNFVTYKLRIGIPQAKPDVLFSLDETISAKGTSGETGLGLGLQLVHEFVALNNGKAEAESQEDKGTTFKVTLPPDTQSNA